MKRIRIIHDTAYHYHAPVTFGTHLAMLRPREGHDVHVASSQLEIEPRAQVRWRRDIYGNSIAILDFAEPAECLRVFSEVDVDLYDDVPIDCLIDPGAQSYPFQYCRRTKKSSSSPTGCPATRTTARPCNNGCDNSTSPVS